MQSKLAAIVDLMKQGELQVSNGVNASNEAGKTLEEIVSRSQNVAEMINEISGGVAQQLEIASLITEEVDTVAEIAEKNGNSVEQVVSFSLELKQQVAKLREIVGNFKL